MHLLETILVVEEFKPDALAKFPLLQVIAKTVLKEINQSRTTALNWLRKYGGGGGQETKSQIP